MDEEHHEYRNFEGIDDNESPQSMLTTPHDHKNENILSMIEENIIGENMELPGPFGPRPCVYADWTASGRLLRQVGPILLVIYLCQVESYLNNEVYPLYGNTHSSASRTGHQSTSYRHESRQIIAQAVNAHVMSMLIV